MPLSLCILVVSLAAFVYAYVPESTLATDLLSAESLVSLLASLESGELETYLGSRGVQQPCKAAKIIGRREYSTFSDNEKLAYTAAVKCLMASPSKILPGLAPGARSRYDDFVANYINQTRSIHFTGNFFHWHRYYIWSFETALREECGYKGYLPYWNWAKCALDPLNSPYLDGSPYSQGGNGVWAPHNCNATSACIRPTLPIAQFLVHHR
ncbi:hypothetical protein QBC46DRAFT_267919 [Diplogelasinospora grovesii]|uniref:Tyrosinase copper-binding domain-containing protein n=1 Tax=Diplogelasinospora grovesii TaxID=303347 RepID=A0AAN6S2B9_9PEZI|nr:hypothetical protein QBC46DRAFT_267919 [Diplogelasinospora grovesii]